MNKQSANKIITNNEEETWRQGFVLGQKLTSGAVVALYGNLGAGKTKFLQGFSHGLGVKENVNSPTFNILKLYKVNGHQVVKNFCHIDAYRLNSEEDLIALGVEEYLADKATVTAIEWADKIKKIWPKNVIKVRLRVLSENKRELFLKKALVKTKAIVI